jgi:endo-1,4-beta-xylanase
MRAKILFSGVATFLALAGCGGGGTVVTESTGGSTSTVSSGGQAGGGSGGGSGGITSTGGTTTSGGTSGTGGSTVTSSTTGSGGATSAGGTTTTSSTGGTAGAGGTTAAGGTTSSGGRTGSGGATTTAAGGTNATGGSGPGNGGATGTLTGGVKGTGGMGPRNGGATGTLTGGVKGTGGTGPGSGGSTGTSVVDCNAAMPSGGTDHCGQNTQGSAGGLSWSLWSNAINGNGCITTFSTPAFSARWNGNNDFLARVGLEFGNGSKTYDQYGTIEADFTFKKSGSGGGFSYIGMYGWSTNPCVEYYILDDSYGSMPFTPWNASQKGSATVIDGENYKFYQNKTNGTGGSRCSGVSQWDQFWSVRQKARQCGTITVSEHFKAWDAAGMKLGGLLEVKILVETGGGSGSIEFPIANVTKSQ